jgi:fatty-acyl-CoA synthase
VPAEPLRIDAPMTLRDQIEARACHAEFANRTFLMHDDAHWTYGQFRNESVRMAQFLLRTLGATDGGVGNVAIMLENHLELASLLGGCAYAKGVLFGINTGLRGEVLAGVLNHSKARLLIVNEQFYAEVARVQDRLEHIAPDRILIVPSAKRSVEPERDLRKRLESEIGPALPSLEAPSIPIAPSDNLMVIYTSGTTGLPKGINNNHFKLIVTGLAVASSMGLHRDDTGYICMPLFHSNSMFVGFMPAFHVGARIGLRERFSATRFLDDVRAYGATYWNYVGEPVHYVLSAVEKQHGGDAARIRAELTEDPRVKLRFTVGNGAAPPDIDRMMRYFGLEDMFELYGSTEAAISTFRRKGDPRGSVGEVRDAAVKILNERGEECAPARLDADGHILNYEEAVGEICRVAADTALFQGYYDNDGANRDKYRDGVYHSGDLGHIVVIGDRRFLFFDGRTADWIRKDGENFSASQVGRLISEHPDVALGVAYGVPCTVSDELVMAAIKLREGAEFKPKEFFLWCEAQVDGGSMDRKWFPDFVRIVQDFEYTETQKVLVRHLKATHFNRELLPAEPIYWRRRGDVEFRPFSKEDYAKLREQFAAAERVHLLDHH